MEENQIVKVYCFRYMWTLKSVKEKVNVKFVTDVVDGLQAFEKQIIQNIGDDLESFGREYVCEYDVSRLSLFESIVNNLKDGDKNEKV